MQRFYKIFLTVLLAQFFWSSGSMAQAPNFLWARSTNMDTSNPFVGNSSNGYSVETDVAGNSYTVGSFDGTARFATGHVASKGVDDAFILKHNASGTEQWARTVGGASARAWAYNVAADKAGNLYVTGDFIGTVTFSNSTTTLSNAGTRSVPFIAKYDSNGNLQWAQKFGEVSYFHAIIDMGLDGEGNVFVAGRYRGVFTVAGSTFSTSAMEQDYDVFIAKLNGTGAVQWVQKASGQSSIDYTTGLAVDNAGNAYLTAYCVGATRFGTIGINGNGPQGANEYGVIAKYNGSGTVQWAKKISTSVYGHKADRIAVDNSGNAFVIGRFSTNAVIGNTTLQVTGEKHYLVKYNESGDVQWAQTTDGTSTDIKVDNYNSRLYLTGLFWGTAYFGDTRLSGNSERSHMFIANYNSSGVAQWAIQTTGTGSAQTTGLAIDPAGNAFAAGIFGGTVALGNTTLQTNGSQMFVAKIGYDNVAPTDITLSRSTVKESVAAGTEVGTFTSTDQAGSIYHNYTLVSGEGSADNAAFTLTDVGSLTINAVPNHATKNNYSIRVRSTDDGGLSFEKAFTITVIPSYPVITSQPMGVTLTEGGNTSFGVASTGDNLTFQWQVSQNGGSSFTDISNEGVYSGATSDSLRLNTVPLAMNGYQYRVAISNGTTVVSEAVLLKVMVRPLIATQPSSRTITEGANTIFGVASTGDNLTFQWQVSQNGGSSFTDISNEGVYSGAASDSLKLNNVPLAMNGYRYRVVVSNGNSVEFSNPVTLTVNPIISYALSIGALSHSSVEAGGRLEVSFQATGEFPAGNEFRVQLSDAAGSFNSPTDLGGWASKMSPLAVRIPYETAAGASYRVRVVSTSPGLTTSSLPLAITGRSLALTGLSSSTVEVGRGFSVSFSAEGAFLDGNEFRVQLSDASGSFASPTDIGGWASKASPMGAVIPFGTAASSGYRVRVISTSPMLVSSSLPLTVTSRAIFLTGLSVSSVEAGRAISVSFSANGTYATGNEFRVQLSDASGSFSSPTDIGGWASKSSPMGAIIPAGTAASSGYKVRVVSTNPGVMSATLPLTVTSRSLLLRGISASSVQAGGSLAVHFTAEGTYAVGNEFRIQLSDASGSFSSPVDVGGWASKASPMGARIPASTQPSVGYRVRVVSTNPSLVSAVSVAFTVTPGAMAMAPAPAIKSSSEAASVAAGNDAVLRLWPNPVQGNEVTLSLADLPEGEALAEVLDLSGRRVTSQTIYHAGGRLEHNLTVAGLKEGLYIVTISSVGKVHRAKLIVR